MSHLLTRAIVCRTLRRPCDFHGSRNGVMPRGYTWTVSEACTALAVILGVIVVCCMGGTG